QTEVEVDNQDYRAVLPNANDWTFICIELDPHSRDFFIEKISGAQWKADNVNAMLSLRCTYLNGSLAI
ncbi:MAG: hypothetical protein AAF215_32065, partial [Cyanobacteria bacterium P01_A01_bin.123]